MSHPVKKYSSIPCIRCGLCCVAGPCYYGDVTSKDDHSCFHLKFKDGVAHCGLLPNIMIEEHLGIGCGCLLRKDKCLLDCYRKTYTNLLLKKIKENEK